MSFADRFNLFSYKLQELLLLIFAFVFVFNYRYGHIVLVFLVTNWLLRFFTKGNNLSKVLTLHFLIQSSLFFIAFTGLLNTADLGSGFKVLEKLLPILILPLLFTTSPPLTLEIKNRILISYLMACLLAVVISLVITFLNDIQFNGFSSISLSQYTGHSLASALNIHPTYLSLYIVFGVAISFKLVDFQTSLNIYTIFFFLFVILSSVFVMLLNARTEIIILFLYYTGLVIYYTSTRGNKNFKIIIALCSFVPLMVVLLTPPLKESMSRRFAEIKDIADSNLIGTNRENGVNQRAFLWEQGSLLVMENPVIGIGTGDFDTVFKKHLYNYINEHPHLSESKVTAVKSFIKNELNVHNQYLQVLIQYGVVGFICFLLTLLVLLYWFFQNRNYIYCIFLIFIASAMISENILDRASGIYLFSFFNAFFGTEVSKKPAAHLNREYQI